MYRKGRTEGCQTKGVSSVSLENFAFYLVQLEDKFRKVTKDKPYFRFNKWYRWMLQDILGLDRQRDRSRLNEECIIRSQCTGRKIRSLYGYTKGNMKT